MTGRRWDNPNHERPRGLERVIAIVPQCFAPDQWAEYVEEAWRGTLNDPAARARMSRGEAPEYCHEYCTAGYMRNMRALGRCHPPHEQIDLLTTGETNAA